MLLYNAEIQHSERASLSLVPSCKMEITRLFVLQILGMFLIMTPETYC